MPSTHMTANGLRAAVGIRNALLLAPFAWAVLIIAVLFLIGVI